LDIVLKKDSSIVAPKNQELAMTVHDARKKATQQDVIRALDLWKNYLVKCEDYLSFQKRSEALNIERIRVLKGAMSDYLRFNPGGPQPDSHQHQKFGPLQREYNIPLHYTSPAHFFREVETNLGALFKFRLCSVWEFYALLCQDTPGFRPSPHHYERRGVQPLASKAAEISKPVVQTIIRAPSASSSSSSANPSKLTWLQRDVADKAAVRHMKKPRDAPVPEEGDTSDSTEDDQLYDDQLLPDDKIRIKKLQTSIKRIKQQDYKPHYLRDKERAIN
jgi:hypothetical protein